MALKVFACFYVRFQQEGTLFVTFPKSLVLVEQPFKGGILTEQKGSARDLFMAVVVEMRIISGPEGSVNRDAVVEVPCSSLHQQSMLNGTAKYDKENSRLTYFTLFQISLLHQSFPNISFSA